MEYEEGFNDCSGEGYNFEAGVHRMHRASTRCTVWANAGDHWIQYVLNAQADSIDVSYPHVGMDSYLVVRQPELGKANMALGCWTVPIRRDKNVIRSVSLFIYMVAAVVEPQWVGDW